MQANLPDEVRARPQQAVLSLALGAGWGPEVLFPGLRLAGHSPFWQEP